MFKKTLKIQGSSTLSGKDKKVLIENLKKSFNPDTVDKIFKDSETVMQEKLSGSKMIVYLTDEYPAFIDATGKGDMFPSLYVVSEYPRLVRTLKLKEGIDSLILGGANLMWSGVNNIDQLGEFKKDDVRKILNHKDQLIALGAVGCEMKDLAAEKEKGIAAYILHTNSDKLWEHGPQQLIVAKEQDEEPKPTQQQQQQQQVQVQETKPAQVQKEAPKEAKKTKAKPKPPSSDESSDDAQEDLNMLMKNVGKKPQPQQKKAPAAKKAEVPVAKPTQFSDDEDKKGKKQPKKAGKGKQEEDDKKKQKQESDDEEESKQGPAIPIKVMDEYIREAFFNAIKIGVNDKNLPLDAQTFLQNYMVFFKKENIELDFKNSSFQKIGKFLQQMTKEGVIEYKETKKSQQPQIVSIDRGCEQYDQWEPTVLKAARHKDDGQNSEKQAQYKANIEIVELFKPLGSIAKIFEKPDQKDKDIPQEILLTREEYRKALNAYVQANCKKEHKNIQLSDNILRNAIPPEQDEDSDSDDEPAEQNDSHKQQQQGQEQGKKKRVGKKIEKDIVSQEHLYKKIEEQMEKSYRITYLNTKKTELKKGEFKGLQLIAEKQHNKNVNRVVGLEVFGFDHKLKPEDLYSFSHLQTLLTQKFNCPVNVHELPNKEREIVIQNNVIDELPDFFANEIKIESRFIHEQNKVGTKKKQQTFMK